MSQEKKIELKEEDLEKICAGSSAGGYYYCENGCGYYASKKATKCKTEGCGGYCMDYSPNLR